MKHINYTYSITVSLLAWFLNGWTVTIYFLSDPPVTVGLRESVLYIGENKTSTICVDGLVNDVVGMLDPPVLGFTLLSTDGTATGIRNCLKYV